MNGIGSISGNQYLEASAQACFLRAEHWQKKVNEASLDGDKSAENLYRSLRDEAGACQKDIRSLKEPQTEADLVSVLASLCNEMSNKFDNPIYASMHRMATTLKNEVENRKVESAKCESV